MGVLVSATAWASPPVYEPVTTPALQVTQYQHLLFTDIQAYDGVQVAVGAFGGLFIKKEGQRNWEQKIVPTSVLLTDVYLASEDRWYVSGHDGVLLMTPDAGKTWQMLMTGFQLYNIESPWLQAYIEELEQELEVLEDEHDKEELDFVIEELGYIRDGLEVQQEAGPTKPLLSSLFISEQLGFVVGAYGTAIMTYDAGMSWQVFSHRIENPEGYHINSVFKTQSGALFLVGEAGMVRRSLDQGQEWDWIEIDYDGSLFGGFEDSKSNIWLYGLRGHVFVSSDQGNTFKQVQTKARYNLNAGIELQDGRLVFVGQSGTLVLIDPVQQNSQLIMHESGQSLTGVIDQQGQLVMSSRAGIQVYDLPQRQQ